jgi:hypothetical protein
VIEVFCFFSVVSRYTGRSLDFFYSAQALTNYQLKFLNFTRHICTLLLLMGCSESPHNVTRCCLCSALHAMVMTVGWKSSKSHCLSPVLQTLSWRQLASLSVLEPELKYNYGSGSDKKVSAPCSPALVLAP